jgi:hypothetical protein
MNIKLDNFFNDNIDIYNNIIDLLTFLNKTFNEYNNIIIKRNRLLDFYDLFFYMLNYNSTVNSTHRSANYNFNINNDFDVSENAFINKLVKLDSDYIKQINDKFINFFYTMFKINVDNIITATDGSNIKLLSSLSNNFKLNKNGYYTNAIISCVYDVNNNIPLFMNINKSFNEVDNLLKQLDDNIINKYKITNVTDRGYDDIKLVNYYLKNKLFFVSRITKNNSFVKNLNNNNNTIFTYTYNNISYQIRIIKFTNMEKPNVKENKNELLKQIAKIGKKINLIKNKLTDAKIKYQDLHNDNKLNNKKIKLSKLKKKKLKNLKKTINNNRILKNIEKKNIINCKNSIDDLIKKKNIIKVKYNKLETFEHSDFYIITNNLNLTFNELKKIYSKRWGVETSFNFDKTVLNLNQMNNKNVQLIKQNVYIIQFISIMNAFIIKLLEKKVKDDCYLNKTQIYESLHKNLFDLFKKLLIKKNFNEKKKINKLPNDKIKKTPKLNLMKDLINKLSATLRLLLKYQLKKPKKNREYERIKKRINNNKFNNRINKDKTNINK